MSLTETHQERLDAIKASKAAGKPTLHDRPADKHGHAPKKKPRVRDRRAERERAAARAAGTPVAPKPLDRIGQLQAVAAVRDQVGGEVRLKQLLEVLALLDEEDAPPAPSLMREGSAAPAG